MKNMKKKSPDEDAANDINWDWEDDWVSIKITDRRRKNYYDLFLESMYGSVFNFNTLFSFTIYIVSSIFFSVCLNHSKFKAKILFQDMNDIATRKTDEDAAKDINWDWEEDWVSYLNINKGVT